MSQTIVVNAKYNKESKDFMLTCRKEGLKLRAKALEDAGSVIVDFLYKKYFHKTVNEAPSTIIIKAYNGSWMTIVPFIASLTPRNKEDN